MLCSCMETYSDDPEHHVFDALLLKRLVMVDIQSTDAGDDGITVYRVYQLLLWKQNRS